MLGVLRGRALNSDASDKTALSLMQLYRAKPAVRAEMQEHRAGSPKIRLGERKRYVTFPWELQVYVVIIWE